MTTPARYRALQWFHDHEAEGPLAVLRRERPSVRMRNLMERERQLMRIELGQFNHHRWLLTGMGEQVLAEKTRGQGNGRRQRGEKRTRRMLDLNEVLKIVPIARSTLLRMVKLKQFPQPTYISENRARQSQPSRPPHPAPTSVTIAKRPSSRAQDDWEYAGDLGQK